MYTFCITSWYASLLSLTFSSHFVCFLVEFWTLLPAYLTYVHEHGQLGFRMLPMETTVFDCVCWFSSSHDRKGRSYPVEYYLELVKEYSEGKIHKSELEPRNGNVQTGVLSTLLIKPGETLKSVPWSLFTMNDINIFWPSSSLAVSCTSTYSRQKAQTNNPSQMTKSSQKGNIQPLIQLLHHNYNMTTLSD